MKAVSYVGAVASVGLVLFAGLNTLDLLFRGEIGFSIVFLVIGIVGIVISNKMLDEIKKEEDGRREKRNS